MGPISDLDKAKETIMEHIRKETMKILINSEEISSKDEERIKYLAKLNMEIFKL